MSDWKEGYSQSPGKCTSCGGFIPVNTFSVTRYNDPMKKWERAHIKCVSNELPPPPCSPPKPEPTPSPTIQAADAMGIMDGKRIVKEFVAAHPKQDEQFPSEGFDEMHCLLHLDHEMRERAVEHERIMILQIDTLNKMLKQFEALQVNLTSSNNRMAGSMDGIAMQIKAYIKKDYSLED